MKKGTIIHVVVMVVAVIAGTMLAIKLNNDQRALIPEKAELAAIPVGGFHKFAADVEWMLFVNYMGSLSTVDESNVEDVIGRLERLIALDPNLDKLYKDDVSSIAIQDPEKSIELLKKACNNSQLQNNSEIPFYTGFVMVQHLKPANYKEAVDYFKMAAERSGGLQEMKRHYWGYYYRTRAKLLAQAENMDERLALAEILYNELQSERFTGSAGAAGMDGSSIDIKDRLFRALKDIKTPSEDYTPTKQVLDRASEISQKVFADAHLCLNCIQPYGPGESFCTACGTAVQVWGQCNKCHKTIAGAKYCPYCGTAAATK